MKQLKRQSMIYCVVQLWVRESHYYLVALSITRLLQVLEIVSKPNKIETLNCLEVSIALRMVQTPLSQGQSLANVSICCVVIAENDFLVSIVYYLIPIEIMLFEPTNSAED